MIDIGILYLFLTVITAVVMFIVYYSESSKADRKLEAFYKKQQCEADMKVAEILFKELIKEMHLNVMK